MTTPRASNQYFTMINPAEVEFDTLTADKLSATTIENGNWTIGVGDTLSIVSNAIYPSQSFHPVSGAGTLSTIDASFAKPGTTLIIQTIDTSSFIIAASGANFTNPTGGTINLLNIDENVTFVYDGTNWTLTSISVLLGP